MKKIKLVLLAAVLAVGISGCGKDNESIVAEPQWEAVDGGESSESGDSGSNSGNLPDGSSANAGSNGEMSASEKERLAASMEGMIEEQSFEVELDGWGKVFFVSAAPENDSESPRFMLVKDEKTVYTFPETSESGEDKFAEVSAVAFQDYNGDGKTDVIVLVAYRNGENKWNEPRVFLQENSDNMFYLDHPELESYRVENDAQGGPAFYRDTFLEEYLSGQKLTESMASLAGSWAAYVDYADSLIGILSEERQIGLFAKNRAIWTEGMDYANDIFCFTVASLGYNGRLTLIVANQGGTGRYTYSEFYQIAGNGEFKRLETSFKEGDSQPDIIEESMTVYSSFSTSGNRNYFIVHDELRDSPDSYVYRISSLSLADDFVMETPLADKRVTYEGEGYPAHIVSQDCNGNALTEEEYDNFADTYYGNMGLEKKTAAFKWIDVKSLEGMSDEEAAEMLKQAYEGFSLSAAVQSFQSGSAVT